jgi:hypothetical protein
MGKMINAHRQKPQESNHLEDLGVERKNTKKINIRKFDVKARTEVNWLRTGSDWLL